MAAEPVPLEVLGSIPTIDTLLSYVPDSSKSLLVLFDDMNEVLFNSPDVSELYVRISSHFNVSVLATSHTGFCSAKYYQKIMRQLNVIIVWKSLSDKSQLGRSQFCMKVFYDL